MRTRSYPRPSPPTVTDALTVALLELTEDVDP